MANAFFAAAGASTEKSALVPEAVERPGFGPLGRLLPRIVARPIVALGDGQGGLWVGGRAELTSSALTFRPNTMNRAMHLAPESLEVQLPLAAIATIELRRGFITDIIEARSASSTLIFRCFRARAFAAAVEAAWKAMPR